MADFRCINAFTYGDRVIAGGAKVAGNDPILETHRDYFAEIAVAEAVGSETATRTRRTRTRRKAEPETTENEATSDDDTDTAASTDLGL